MRLLFPFYVAAFDDREYMVSYTHNLKFSKCGAPFVTMRFVHSVSSDSEGILRTGLTFAHIPFLGMGCKSESKKVVELNSVSLKISDCG